MFEISCLEPSGDHYTAGTTGRAEAFPVFNGDAPLPGRASEDRAYAMV